MLKKGVIWMIGLAIAVASGLAAMGGVAKNRAPELAIALQPGNGFASEKLASSWTKAELAANKGVFPENIDPAAAKFAKQAFLSEPVTPAAIAVLALDSPAETKRKLMFKALALSRREQLATGWMIADSGAREDIPEILSHYDTMLRTSAAASSVIMPVMAGALANRNFIPPFVEILSKKPPWAREFWVTVIATPEAIGNAAQLRKLLYTPNDAENTFRDVGLIKALVHNRQFETAENLYLLLANQAAGDSVLKNSSFKHVPKFPPFDWQLISTGEYGAVVTDEALQLSAIRNSGGVFARQLVKIPPKIMTIQALADRDVPKNANMFIKLSCAELIKNPPRSIEIPVTGKITQQQISNLQSNCSFYWFDVTARATENGDGFDVRLSSVSLQLNDE